MSGAMPLREFQALARRAAGAGFAGLVVTEAGRTAYLSCAAAALADVDLDIATGVAVAFPRSPMVTASVAWELADATNGRFRLGLGPQVRAHVERRYSAAFERPGPRMRDYVQAVRAVFRAFRGQEPLRYDGEFYQLSLLPPMWSPGPIAVADPPIDVAAVNPWMLRMAGTYADGVHVHPLNTTTYYAQSLVPNLEAGLAAQGRDARTFSLFVPLFTAPGDTAEERDAWREASRTMVAFYGSTPNYAFIFDQLGYAGTTERIRAAQKAEGPAAMAKAIDDELLEHFVVAGTWDELPTRIMERFAGLGNFDVNVVLYHAGAAARRDDGSYERLGDVAKRLNSMSR
ncbi:MAG: TIGR03617 family F420-dependent LLM class oxidoreductase [Actinobacteria bacterium]|nr:TIGR03617 family F420-dependent LLM class oxidoreductase [Actinomycetota bacterium]